MTIKVNSCYTVKSYPKKIKINFKLTSEYVDGEEFLRSMENRLAKIEEREKRCYSEEIANLRRDMEEKHCKGSIYNLMTTLNYRIHITIPKFKKDKSDFSFIVRYEQQQRHE